jgi:hypothetical protein
MNVVVRREIEEAEAKARSLIADIVPLLNRLPQEAIPDVNVHLEKALDAAKTATRAVREKTEKREKAEKK